MTDEILGTKILHTKTLKNTQKYLKHHCLLSGLRQVGKHNCCGGWIQIQPFRQTIDPDDKNNSFTGDLSETSIIDIRDGSNTVVAPFNTLRHGAVMISLHNIVVAFGGWNTENSSPLKTLEVWNPNDQTWINGPGEVFQTRRLKFGMLTLSFPSGTCELGTSYEQFSSHVLN